MILLNLHEWLNKTGNQLRRLCSRLADVGGTYHRLRQMCFEANPSHHEVSMGDLWLMFEARASHHSMRPGLLKKVVNDVS